jgi:hypothetical protein
MSCPVTRLWGSGPGMTRSPPDPGTRLSAQALSRTQVPVVAGGYFTPGYGA